MDDILLCGDTQETRACDWGKKPESRPQSNRNPWLESWKTQFQDESLLRQKETSWKQSGGSKEETKVQNKAEMWKRVVGIGCVSGDDLYPSCLTIQDLYDDNGTGRNGIRKICMITVLSRSGKICCPCNFTRGVGAAFCTWKISVCLWQRNGSQTQPTQGHTEV